MPAPDNRRPRIRFVFSTTALVVAFALFATVLAWERNFVAERRTMRKDVLAHGGAVVTIAEYNFQGGFILAETIPPWRRWIGDESVYYMYLPHGTNLQRAKRLFREAELSVNPPEGVFGPRVPVGRVFE